MNWIAVFNPKRDLREVMDRLRPVLVENGVDMADFEDLYGTVSFSPPESQPMLWGLLAETLQDALPAPVPGAPDWVLGVRDIVLGRA